MELPEGYTTRAPTQEDAEVVAALISACQIADTGASDMSVEEMLDDWHSLDLAEEAVILTAPDGRTAAYADVFNRSFVIVSIYGYVHPDYREVGLGSYLVAWGERWTRDHMPQAQANARGRAALHQLSQRSSATTAGELRLQPGTRDIRNGDHPR
jgi:GNAT superfamily N-acetyltransferase